MYVSRLFDCLDISGGTDPEELGVAAKLFYAKVLRQLQATELLAPKRTWSRAMSHAMSHYIAFKAEEAAHRHFPATASASTHYKA